MKIGELARRAGVATSAVRFYERVGVLPPGRRTTSRYRVYDESDLARLSFVLRAKEVGFSLPEIARLVRAPSRRREIDEIVVRKLREIAERRRTLQLVEIRLRQVQRSDPRRRSSLAEGLVPNEEAAALDVPRAGFEGFARDAAGVVNGAAAEAGRLRHGWIGAEHLLIAFMQRARGAGVTELRSRGITTARARREVLRILGRGKDEPVSRALTPRAHTVLGIAQGIAVRHGGRADSDDLLLGLLAAGDSVAIAVLRELGVDPAAVRRELLAQ